MTPTTPNRRTFLKTSAACIGLPLITGALVSANDAIVPQPADPVHIIPEFMFENGQTLKQMKIGYVTHGKLNAARDNAILIGHGASGNRHSYTAYIGPGKLYDTSRYFIIAPDAIGGGLSTGPRDALGPDFPHYTIRDIMHAEHDLVMRGLGLSHLLAVQGSSMGAQVAIEWGVNYPDFMTGLVLHAPSARANIQFKLIVDAAAATLRLDPKFQAGRYTEPPLAGLRAAGLIYFPWVTSDDYIETLKTPQEYEAARTQMSTIYEKWDANGLLLRYAAARVHDISKPFAGDMKAALSRVKAKALVMPCSTDRTLPAFLAKEIADGVAGATYVELKSPRGHMALTQSDEACASISSCRKKRGGFWRGLRSEGFKFALKSRDRDGRFPWTIGELITPSSHGLQGLSLISVIAQRSRLHRASVACSRTAVVRCTRRQRRGIPACCNRKSPAAFHDQ